MPSIVLALAFFASPLQAGLTADEDLLRRQQDVDAARRDRRIEDVYRPDDAQPAPAASPLTGDEHCIRISAIALTGDSSIVLPDELAALQSGFAGRCLGTNGIREVQGTLTRALVARGLVTSRVLLAEQDLSGGTLTLTVVAGRVGSYEGDTPARTLAAAFPDRSGDILHLPALEQGIENLNRLPGKNARLDLLPGAARATSLVRVNGLQGRSWQTQGSLDGKGLEDEADLLGRVSVVAGNVAGVADRLAAGIGRQLDDHRLDHSENANVAWDMPWGYWHLSLSHDTQRYHNDLPGVFTTYRSAGDSRTSRMELSRVLYRRGARRLALAWVAGDTASRNRIDDTVIEVSSYNLRTQALRLEHSAPWGAAQWTHWLTLEAGDASGPATRPLGGPPIADTRAARLQGYSRVVRPFGDGVGALVFTASGQYAASALFPAQRMSLTADSAVRGFLDASASGSNALALRAEINHGWQSMSERLPGSLQAFVGADIGWVPNDNTVPEPARAASITAGLLWSGDTWQWRLAASDPLGAATTLTPTTWLLATSLSWSY